VRARRAAGALGLTLLLGACTSAAGTGSDAPTGTAAAPSATHLTACPEQPDRPATGGDRLPGLTFDCPGGGSLDLGRAPGVPVVLNLWGSWCPPCRDEMPVLQQLAETAGNRVRVVGVISKDGLPQADTFAADAGVTFPSAFDGDGELMARLGLNQLPYTYFIDAGGALTYTQVGPVRSLDELRGLVADHLGVHV
jgi:cytochrome c biogenesis protein CcmG, thiol:disulfide interchange protein DsbE